MLLRLGRHLLVALEPCLALGLPRLGVGAHPLQLVLEPLLALDVLLPLDLEARRLGLQVGGVVALVRVGPTPVQLQDPLRDVVEEVPVVGDGDDRARVLGQVLLQPLDGLGVQMVGRLVEQEQVRLLEQQLAQGDPAPLAAGQHGDVGIGRRAPQRVHRLLQLGVEVPGVAVVELLLELAHLGEERVVVGIRLGQLGGDRVETVQQRLGLRDALLDVLQHRLRAVELRLLQQDAHRVAGRQDGVAVGRLVQPGHDLEHGRLAGTVRTHDADLRAGVERQRDVVEDYLVAVRLACFAHDVDELSHVGSLTTPRQRHPGAHGSRTWHDQQSPSTARAGGGS